jgi:hypothetical protein
MVERNRAGESHHITLKIGDTTYGFNLSGMAGFQRLDISDFAPRVAAGALNYRDLSVWQVWAMDDWRHGFGQNLFVDATAYSKTTGGIDTRHKDIVTLATKITSSETGESAIKFVDFNSKVYALLPGNGGVREYDPDTDTWADTTQTTGTCLDGVAIGTYLVVSLDGARARKFDGSTWSNVGNNVAPPSDINKLCLHGGYLWASEHGSNWLHYAAEDDASDLYGVQDSEDTDAIQVGGGDIPIVNMISYAGQLYVAREDGIWVIADDNSARLLLDFSRERHSENFQTMAVWRGHLYFSVRQNLYRYTGSTVMDVTPPKYAETWPYYAYGDFKDLTPKGPWLYVHARDTESTWHEALLSFDGVGWHKLWDVTTSPYVINALGYSTLSEKMWLNYTGTAATTGYIPYNSLSDMPYDSYSTATAGVLYTPRFDAGFVDVDKVCHSIRVRSNNCSATKTILIEYSTDNGTWHALGQVTTSPFQLIDFPDPDSSTTYGKMIQLRFTFSTDSAASSPILESFALNYLLRPTAVWGWQLTVPIVDTYRTLEHDVERELTSEEQMNALLVARDQKTPVEFADMWGTVHDVYLSSCQFLGKEWRPGTDEQPELLARLSLTSAE